MTQLCRTLGVGSIGVLSYLFGDLNGLLFALMVCMALDLITGVVIACFKKKMTFQVAIKELAKKIFMLFIVIMAHIVDAAIIGGGETTRNIVICFYLANESMSLLENSAALGVKYPEKLMNILSQLSSENGGDELDDTEIEDN